MSDAFPTFSEIGESNVRAYLRRTQEWEELMTCAPAAYFKVQQVRRDHD